MSVQNKISIPCLNEKPINKEELEKYWTRMNKTLDQIEQIWLDNGKKNYLAGDKISVADIVAVCELEQPLMAVQVLANYSYDFYLSFFSSSGLM